MKTSRYSKSRQTSCDHCASSKLKCDKTPESCMRCRKLGIPCRYPRSFSQLGSNKATKNEGVNHSLRLARNSDDVATPNGEQFLLNEWQTRDDTRLNSKNQVNDQDLLHITETSKCRPTIETALWGYTSSSRLQSDTENADMLDFSELRLVCTIDAGSIRNRWLSAFAPDPNQAAKQYPQSVASFILRILKAYAGTVVRGGKLPPFVHHSQLKAANTNLSLCTCMSLVRACERLFPGAHFATANVLQKEIESISQERDSYFGMTLLSAYQASLLYALVLQFWLRNESSAFLRQAVVYLQDLACATAREGLVCIEEQLGTRPKWEAWIVAEAKRRTLYTMYLFDNVLSAMDGLPTFLGTELQGLPAPAGKSLWQAQTRREWEDAYNAHLVAFPTGGFRIDELWPIQAHSDTTTHEARQRRTEAWLEDLDEFGTMLYAVTSITHNL